MVRENDILSSNVAVLESWKQISQKQYESGSNWNVVMDAEAKRRGPPSLNLFSFFFFFCPCQFCSGLWTALEDIQPEQF